MNVCTAVRCCRRNLLSTLLFVLCVDWYARCAQHVNVPCRRPKNIEKGRRLVRHGFIGIYMTCDEPHMLPENRTPWNGIATDRHPVQWCDNSIEFRSLARDLAASETEVRPSQLVSHTTNMQSNVSRRRSQWCRTPCRYHYQSISHFVNANIDALHLDFGWGRAMKTIPVIGKKANFISSDTLRNQSHGIAIFPLRMQIKRLQFWRT